MNRQKVEELWNNLAMGLNFQNLPTYDRTRSIFMEFFCEEDLPKAERLKQLQREIEAHLAEDEDTAGLQTSVTCDSYAELKAAQEYAGRIASYIVAKYYPENEVWRRCDTLMGVLTQIDNAVTGLSCIKPKNYRPDLIFCDDVQTRAKK